MDNNKSKAELLQELQALQQENQQLRAENAQLKQNNPLTTAEKPQSSLQIPVSNEYLRLLLDHLPVILFAFDSQGVFTISEGKGLADIGLTPGKIVGQSAFDLYKKTSEILGHIKRALAGEAFHVYTTIRTLAFKTWYQPLWHNDKVIGAMGVAINVTESKQLQAELVAHRNQLEEMVLDRTYRLELITMLSGYLNTILDTNRLLDTLVNQVKDHFGYYHVQVYLFNETTNQLEIQASAGDSGDALKKQGHYLKIGDGIVGQVAADNEALLCNDVTQTKQFIHNSLLPNTQSELAIPIRKGQRILGVLDIQSEQKDTFGADDISIMQSIADQTAIALENAWLLSEQQKTIAQLQEVDQLNRKYTRDLETNADISRQLTAILNLNDLLQFVVHRINTAFNLYHTHIYLVDEETGDLVMVEGYGEIGQKLKVQKHRLKIGQGIVGTVALTNQPFMTNNVNTVRNFVRNPLLLNTNSELAVPMRKGTRVLGVLDMQSRQKNRFREQNVALMQSIADQLAIAVHNARLLTELKNTIIKLKEVDRLKSQFLTMMSHELRTPMNAVLGFSELLLLGISGNISEEAKQDVQLIYDNGKHLLDLINDILDIAKIESGLMQFAPQPINVEQTIAEVVSSSKVLKQNHDIDIIVDVPSNLPTVEADLTRLKQILLNLVSNAIKFTDRGQVTIKARIHPQESNKMLFSIIDTGIGISPEKQHNIFNAFEQVDMTDTRAYGGTGLGLTICKELVNKHGGTIGVSSDVGKGSEFYFTIPLTEIDAEFIAKVEHLISY